MPRTFRIVGLWHDLKIDLSPIPVKEVTNLSLNYTYLTCIFFLSFHKLCIHVHVEAGECAQAVKERSAVRVKTDSETGERHTSHGRVELTCFA